MREAKISQVKNQLSRYLALVKKGETIQILDRDRPVAPRAAYSKLTRSLARIPCTSPRPSCFPKSDRAVWDS